MFRVLSNDVSGLYSACRSKNAYWSEEDAAYIAEVPELAGCAADGASYQEALEAAEVVIGEWIETAKDLGRLVPEPEGGRLILA